MTGGLYFRAKNADDLKKVYQSLNRLEPVAGDKATFRPTTPLYPWPLALALLITMGLAWLHLRPRLLPLKESSVS